MRAAGPPRRSGTAAAHRIASRYNALRRYPPNFLACRDHGHGWLDDETAEIGFARNGLVRRGLVCFRCQTQRTDWWYVTGLRYRSTYAYPDGYCLRRDVVPDGGVSRADVRREVLRRAKLVTGARSRRSA